MKKNSNKSKLPVQHENKEKEVDSPGYPLYPDSEDIYGKFKEEENIDPENISLTKEPGKNNKTGKSKKKDSFEDESTSDLDVPGSELDDEQENVGSEDEENNYYSLGGDDHNDLDENK